LALLPQAKDHAHGNRDAVSAPLQRVTVYGLFRQHIQSLAGLPGEKSQFDQSDFGYEWRCEFDIGVPSTGSAPLSGGADLQLQFSLIDLERQLRPAAVLYLVDNGQEPGSQDRLLLSLGDLLETHEQLNRELVQREVSINAFENGNRFIAALARVRESLGSGVTWS